MAYRTFLAKRQRYTAMISWQRRESVKRTNALRITLALSVGLALYFTTHWQRVPAPDAFGLDEQRARFSMLSEGGEKTPDVYAAATRVRSASRPPPPEWRRVGAVAAARGVRPADAVNAQRALIDWWARSLDPALAAAGAVALGVAGDGGVAVVEKPSSRDYRPRADLALVGFLAGDADEARRAPPSRPGRGDGAPPPPPLAPPQ
jgi:hypothetical protein